MHISHAVHCCRGRTGTWPVPGSVGRACIPFVQLSWTRAMPYNMTRKLGCAWAHIHCAAKQPARQSGAAQACEPRRSWGNWRATLASSSRNAAELSKQGRVCDAHIVAADASTEQAPEDASTATSAPSTAQKHACDSDDAAGTLEVPRSAPSCKQDVQQQQQQQQSSERRPRFDDGWSRVAAARAAMQHRGDQHVPQDPAAESLPSDGGQCVSDSAAPLTKPQDAAASTSPSSGSTAALGPTQVEASSFAEEQPAVTSARAVPLAERIAAARKSHSSATQAPQPVPSTRAAGHAPTHWHAMHDKPSSRAAGGSGDAAEAAQHQHGAHKAPQVNADGAGTQAAPGPQPMDANAFLRHLRSQGAIAEPDGSSSGSRDDEAGMEREPQEVEAARRARSVALTLLSHRLYTAAGLAEKLSAKGHSEGVVAHVLSDLQVRPEVVAGHTCICKHHARNAQQGRSSPQPATRRGWQHVASLASVHSSF